VAAAMCAPILLVHVTWVVTAGAAVLGVYADA
jgi:hypothetical protein